MVLWSLGRRQGELGWGQIEKSGGGRKSDGADDEEQNIEGVLAGQRTSVVVNAFAELAESSVKVEVRNGSFPVALAPALAMSRCRMLLVAENKRREGSHHLPPVGVPS